MRAHRRRTLLATAGLVVLIGLGAIIGSGPRSHRGAIIGSGPRSRRNRSAPTPLPSGVQFGASVNLLFNTPGLSPELIVSQLRALRATGVTLARSDALWEASEPAPPTSGGHHYDWGFDDRVAAALAAVGLRWLPILDYTAAWAQSVPGQDHSPPRSAADYAAYAGAFAARYGSTGTFWRSHPGLTAEPVQTYEIWNEPDNRAFWTSGPDPARYADLYSAARSAIIAADPPARVIVGGLTKPTQFLPAMLAARPELRGGLDGVAVHPYGTPEVLLAKLQADRTLLDGLGLGTVPLYVTEFGWTTSPARALDYAPAARRPGFILRALGELSGRACGVAAAVLYTWYSAGQDPANSQQWFGIDSASGAPTPDTAAFTRGLRTAPTQPSLRCGG